MSLVTEKECADCGYKMLLSSNICLECGSMDLVITVEVE